MTPGATIAMHRAFQRGVTLIELMIGITIVALLLFLGIPSLFEWLANSQIRTAAETTQAGLQLARAEAIQRNTSVRFQFTSTLTSACALSTSGTNWVVSLDDPTGKCDIAPSPTTDPRIVQVKAASEGASNVVVAATGNSAITFNGMGRTTAGIAHITQIDFSNPSGGACQHAGTPGPMRCLRILITSAGRVKMCDPKVSDNTDPRHCS